jgi:hypothetical protein
MSYGADLSSASHGLWALATAFGVVAAAWWVIEAARDRRLGLDEKDSWWEFGCPTKEW